MQPTSSFPCLTLALLSGALLLKSHAGMTVAEEHGNRALRYRVTDLGAVGGRANTYVINARCLNNRGQVVGWANDGTPYDFENDTAFLWAPQQGARVLPGLPNAVTSLATAINDRGDAVGFSGDPFPFSTPTLWTRRGPQALTLPAGYQGGLAFGINDRGLVVGMLITDDGRPHPVAWQDGNPALLPLLENTANGSCYAVANCGDIVGASGGIPVLWKHGQVIGLGTAEGERGQANAVNDQGQVVGFAFDAEGHSRAFVWEDGALATLPSDAFDSAALSINNRGQIVGAAGAGNLLGDATLWQRGQRVILGETIPANSGWVLIEADCINDRGQITGLGMLNGVPRVFLLTPRD
ncbi:MAG: hypothetical protein IT581_19480 [Verrucomicrobiales bacterium]|nr:hypothetical protein [Verrucomicrobiales bacterium]